MICENKSHGRPMFVANDTTLAEPTIEKLAINLLPKLCRHESMEDRQYIVVPMVILTEGVHNGSQGPLYYPEEELGKTPAAWNYKPIVVYHPELNGVGISACDPNVINNRKVGVMMNTRFEKGKLKSEAWIEKERANNVDERIMAAVENGEMMELSTGVFVDAESQTGEWNGEAYTAIARNYRPDHLALLPDKIGACSIADGAGFLRNQDAKKNPVMATLHKMLQKLGMIDNEMSHDNIRRALRDALFERFNITGSVNDPFIFVEDVYSNFFVYENDGKLFRLGYSASDTGVTLADEEPVEVVRVTEYRTVDGAFVGNSNQPEPTNPMNEKEKLVDAIINNKSGWSKDDREKLMAFTEDQLKQVQNIGNPAPNPEGEGEEGKTQNQPAAKGDAATNQEPAKNQNQQPPAKGGTAPTGNEQAGKNQESAPMTVEEYIAGAPAPIQEVLSNSISIYSEEKQRLIDSILNNKNNSFTKEQLETRPLGELKNIARLAGAETTTRTPNYAGQGHVPADNENEEEPLELPALNFAAK